MAKILLLEPYYAGSHEAWTEGLLKHSTHEIELLTLPGRFWKWRMHGASVHFAEEIKNQKLPRLIIASTMMNVAEFKGLLQGEWKEIPVLTYFHENQLSYPKSEKDTDIKANRENHYGYTNYTSALVSDLVLFNSEFHRSDFINEASKLLQSLPDHTHPETLEEIRSKSYVIYPGIESFKEAVEKENRLTLVWNHRFEHDKNPKDFLSMCVMLKKDGIDFQLVFLGVNEDEIVSQFSTEYELFKDSIIHLGYVKDKKEYWQLLSRCHVQPVTSNHDFFGISVVEAMSVGVKPVLPNRLSYPEIIPAEMKDQIIYQNMDHMRSMLNIPDDDQSSILKKHSEKFHWKNIIKEYDIVFDELIN